MRTTIEITDEQRSALLAMAAARGTKGFSALVQEALDRYLATRAQDAARIAAARASRGSLDDHEASDLAEACSQIRSEWR